MAGLSTDEEEFYTVAQVAKRLKTTENAIRCQMQIPNNPNIPPFIKLGRRRLFPVEDFIEWKTKLRGHSATTKPSTPASQIVRP